MKNQEKEMNKNTQNVMSSNKTLESTIERIQKILREEKAKSNFF